MPSSARPSRRNLSGVLTLGTVVAVLLGSGVANATRGHGRPDQGHLPAAARPGTAAPAAPGPGPPPPTAPAATATATSWPPTLPVTVRRFVPAYLTPFVGTQADAVALAKRADVLAVHRGQVDAYLPAMRAANPQLVVLLALDGTRAQPAEQASLPSSEFLTSVVGQRCVSLAGDAVMNPTDAGWIANRISAAKAAKAYDGVLLDTMGPATVTRGTLSCVPLDPRTGDVYQPAAWLRDTAGEARRIKEAVPGVVVANGLDSGAAFADPAAPTSVLETAADGAVAESWLRPAGSPLSQFPSLADWQKALDLLESTDRQQTFVMTETWPGGSPVDIDAWHVFSLATYLLGAGPTTAYGFAPTDDRAGIDGDLPLDGVDLGPPNGAYTVDGALYERTFANGEVVVNPGGPSQTVDVSGYCDLNGRHVESLTLGMNGAALLRSC